MKEYGLVLAFNFAVFPLEDRLHPIYKQIAKTGEEILENEEDPLELEEAYFQVHHQNFKREDPYVGILQYDKLNKKYMPLGSRDNLSLKNVIPIINFTFNPESNLKFTELYLSHIQSYIDSVINSHNFNGSVQIFISGHGYKTNAISTGSNKVNKGYITLENIVHLLDKLILGKDNVIKDLELQLVACGAASKKSHDHMYALLTKYSYPKKVVAYSENITLGRALVKEGTEMIKEKLSSKTQSYKDEIKEVRETIRKIEGFKPLKQRFDQKFRDILSTYMEIDAIKELVKSSEEKTNYKYNNELLHTIIDKLKSLDEEVLSADDLISKKELISKLEEFNTKFVRLAQTFFDKQIETELLESHWQLKF
jgi:hypothetical protein